MANQDDILTTELELSSRAQRHPSHWPYFLGPQKMKLSEREQPRHKRTAFSLMGPVELSGESRTRGAEWVRFRGPSTNQPAKVASFAEVGSKESFLSREMKE